MTDEQIARAIGLLKAASIKVIHHHTYSDELDISTVDCLACAIKTLIEAVEATPCEK